MKLYFLHLPYRQKERQKISHKLNLKSETAEVIPCKIMNKHRVFIGSIYATRGPSCSDYDFLHSGFWGFFRTSLSMLDTRITVSKEIYFV